MISIPPRDTSPNQDSTSTAPAAHRHRHSRPHHHRHREHSPTHPKRQMLPISTPGLCFLVLSRRAACLLEGSKPAEAVTAFEALYNGFLEGAHPIAAEITTCGLPGVEPQIVTVL